MTEHNTGIKDMFLRGIAILGLIAVLLLGAWGIIQIAVHLPGFLAGVGGSITSVFNRESSPTATTTPATSATETQPAPTKATGNKGSNTSSTYVPAPRRANLWGSPDLSVRIVFQSIYVNRAVVQFEVVNLGTNVVGSGWTINAQLPWPYQRNESSYTWNAGPQQALYPGDRIVYTLGFDAPNYRCFATVTLDPYNQVYELNEYNNTASISF